MVKQANKHIRIEKKIIAFLDLYIKRRHQQEILRGKTDMQTEPDSIFHLLLMIFQRKLFHFSMKRFRAQFQSIWAQKV